MKGDFSRNTFRKGKHYNKVNMQQGRVQTDADWNEQADIVLHHLGSLLQDIIGKCGAPIENAGFKIAPSSGNEYEIGSGHYYVDGMMCENEASLNASGQPDLPCIDEHLFCWSKVPGDDASGLRKFIAQRLGDKWKSVEFRKSSDGREIRGVGKGSHLSITRDQKVNTATLMIDKGLVDRFAVKDGNGQIDVFYKRGPALPCERGTHLVYLDVWERHVTGLDDPEILEPALGGPDTATRTKIVWQVRVQRVKVPEKLPSKQRNARKKRLWICPPVPESGRLRARSDKASGCGEPNAFPRKAGYRGASNQLYRVEIHDGGEVGKTVKPTFKWSRDNGCVVAGVERFSDNGIVVTRRGKDGELGFSRGHWVEVIDDRHELWGEPGTFIQLADVKMADSANDVEIDYDPSSVDGEPLTSDNFPRHFNPKARRWDMRNGPMEVAVPTGNDGYIELEDGVEVQFEKAAYRTGDYWLIPARAALADVMWPQEGEGPKAVPPEGIKHHLCPLALIRYDGGRTVVISDCRTLFPPITSLFRNVGRASTR